uniref:Transcriptional regulator n=1 Tax=Pseudomonas phage HRDY3 TaxID=3236930 RepID=A0AB39CEN0_9VIRU
MKLDGRKLQKWRMRLGIKQLDLAQYLCIDQRDLNRIENRMPVPRAWELREHIQEALTHLQDTPLYDLHVEAVRMAKNTEGFLAVMQVMTKHDTTTGFYVDKREQARAFVRIVDALRFEKGALPHETLLLVKFEKGPHLQIYANPMRVVQHVETFYVQGRKVASVERRIEAA